ncbi:MAG TPA: GAF domain-containing protein [Fimbriimonadales bacterium]|nr:GAF domain-containing protein [Fimbriimonadales bacterium]
MYEFACRLVAAIGLFAVSRWFGQPPMEIAWIIGVLTATYAAVAFLVESKKKTNPAFAGLVAGLDSLAISAALAYSGWLHFFGLIVVAPLVYAVAKRGSNPLATGAIAAAALVFANAMAIGTLEDPIAFAQSAGILIVALFANSPRIVVRPKTIQQMIAELAEPAIENSTQALIELREKYRRLAREYRELERKSRVDRLGTKVLLGRAHAGGALSDVMNQVREMMRAEGIILFTKNQLGDRFIVNEKAGRVPKDSITLSIPIQPNDSAQKLQLRINEAIASSQKDYAEELSFCSVLLTLHGKLIGILTLFIKDSHELEDLRRRAEEASEVIARVIVDEREHAGILRKLRESELLYEIACRIDGAATVTDLSRRVVQVLKDILPECDISIYKLQDEKPTLMAREGRVIKLFETLLYQPEGIEGWLRGGGKPIFAYSASNHPDIHPAEAAKLRVGSYFLVPIAEGDQIIGFISVSSRTEGALGKEDAKTLTDVATEFAHTLSVLRESKKKGSTGLLSVTEFQKEMMEISNRGGCIVYIEPLRFRELENELGKHTIELAARQLGLLIHRHSPRTARICRKSDYSYIVLLPDTTLQEAQEWANHIMTLAAMRSYDSYTERTPVPLAVRARPADLNARIEDFQKTSIAHEAEISKEAA